MENAKTFAVFVLQGSFRAVFSKKKTYRKL